MEGRKERQKMSGEVRGGTWCKWWKQVRGKMKMVSEEGREGSVG